MPKENKQNENEKTSAIREYYIDRVKDYKMPEYKVLDWESKEAQEKRFETFINAFSLKGSTMLDVGCGLGNLAEYIDKKNIKLYYIGVDLMPEMIERANKKTFENIKPQFMVMDVFNEQNIEKDVDYIYSSGIFNLNLGNNKDFLKKALKSFFSIARKGVCFNLLDKSIEKLYGNKYFYYDKFETIQYTKSILEDIGIKYEIELSDKYLSNDFTIIVKF